MQHGVYGGPLMAWGSSQLHLSQKGATGPGVGSSATITELYITLPPSLPPFPPPPRATILVYVFRFHSNTRVSCCLNFHLLYLLNLYPSPSSRDSYGFRWISWKIVADVPLV